MAGAGGSSRLTETGLSVGTPYYMSPEQATGDQQVGPASDTYALAAVLYEILTGDPPHVGSTAQAVLGKIIQGLPVSATASRPSVPANVDAAIRKALERLPADRFTGAQDFAKALADAGFRYGDGAVVGEAIGRGLWNPLSISLASLVLVFAGGLGWSLTRTDSATLGRFSIILPDSVPMVYVGSASLGNGRRALAISRDGSMLVYVGHLEGVNRLYTRPMDSYEVEALPGTEGAYNPFLSPDGLWIGFFVDNEVRKVSLDGQDPVTLGTVINPMGADWGFDDQIVAGNEGGRLTQISAEGGSTTVLRERNWFLYPQILPGSTEILNTGWSGVRASNVRTGGDRPIRPFASNGRYVPSGHLMWNQLSTLFAAPFDLEELSISGQAVPILSGVRTEIYGGSHWDVSDNGTLVYAPGAAVATLALTWVGSSGLEALPFEGTAHGTFELSPDETRLVIVVGSGPSDIWVYDLLTGGRERLTSQGAVRYPVWSPDGTQLAFAEEEDGRALSYVMTVDAGAEARRIAPDLLGAATSWSGDLMALEEAPGVAVFDMNNTQLIEVAPEPAWGGVLSPDGTKIAYTTGASGEYQIFGEPFPPTGLRRQVSTQGGSEEPRWSRDGTKLYYRNDQRIMVSLIPNAPEPSPGAPSVALEMDFVNIGRRSYEVATDGRFLIVDGGTGLATRLNVIPNWFEELKRRVSN